jgi:hypothetical protein
MQHILYASTLLTLFACGGEDVAPRGNSSSTASSSDGSSGNPGPYGPNDLDSGTIGAPAKQPVQGKLVDYLGAPVADARVRIVDALGNMQEAKSNGSGSFSFADVPAPYDLRVLPAQGVYDWPHAYFKLAERDIRLTVATPTGLPTIWNKAVISVPVNVGACLSCSVQVYTTSPDGGYGRSTFQASNVPSSTLVSVEHQWATKGNPAPSGNFTVDVLVSDSTYSTFQYQRAGSFSGLQPNGNASISAVSPTSIGKFGPITISVNTTDIPAVWSKDLQVFLNLPGTQLSMYLQRVFSNSLVTHVPNVPGATFGVQVGARGDTKYDGQGNIVVDRISGTGTGELALSTANVALTLRAGPRMVRPLPEGQLSLQSAGFEWAPQPGRVFDIQLSSVDGKGLGRFITSETGIPFARLAKLGIVINPSVHVLDLSSYVGTVGELVGPTPPSRPMESTRDSYRFTVTP